MTPRKWQIRTKLSLTLLGKFKSQETEKRPNGRFSYAPNKATIRVLKLIQSDVTVQVARIV